MPGRLSSTWRRRGSSRNSPPIVLAIFVLSSFPAGGDRGSCGESWACAPAQDLMCQVRYPPAGCPMTRWQRDVPPLEWMACHLSECRHRGRKALHGCGKLAGAISRASCSCLHFINHDVRAGGKNRHDPERGVLTPDKGRRISRPSTTAAALPDGRTVRPQIFLVRALMLSGVGLIDLAL